jgi:hypothetical protein
MEYYVDADCWQRKRKRKRRKGSGRKRDMLKPSNE